MDWIGIVAGGAAVLMANVIYSQLVEHVIVYDYEAGFRYRDGKLKDSLSAGRYRLRRGRDEIRRLDLRRQFQTIAGQEVLTADQVQVKLSLVLGYTIREPRKLLELENHQQVVHLTLQMLLREAVQPLKLDQLLLEPEALRQTLSQRAETALADLGLSLASLAIKDLLLPGDLKRLYAQTLKAQKEAQAALEKARGEQAALRSLANAARMLDRNPSLLQLRLLQSIDQASVGHTIVFHPAAPAPETAPPAPAPEA